MKPRSCAGFTSACPPWAAATRFIASTASRLSRDSDSIMPAKNDNSSDTVRLIATIALRQSLASSTTGGWPGFTVQRSACIGPSGTTLPSPTIWPLSLIP